MKDVILASDDSLWEDVRRFSIIISELYLSISRQNTLVARRSRGAVALELDSQSAHVPDPTENY